MMSKTTFALFYGNRAFMPGEVINEARPMLEKAVTDAGYDFISMDVSLTSYGAAETVEEAQIFANFLEQNRGKFDGVICCLSNFGDETATVAALKDAGVPILMQAVPDEIGKMDFAHRRDSFCGKLAICDLLSQYAVPFSLTQSHVVALDSAEFQDELEKFAATCRVVRGLTDLNVVAIGARTTAFKTMRFDELTAQKYNISVETIDLSDFFMRMRDFDTASADFKDRLEAYKNYADFSNAPAEALENIVRASLAADDVAEQFQTDTMTLRCWDEFQKEMNISPCNMVSELNNRGIICACELDIGNAIAMKALSSASGAPSVSLDYNNNYGEEKDKCVLFHCGPVPAKLMAGKGEIVQHKMFQKTMGDDVSWGVNQGRIKPMPITLSSLKTRDGIMYGYLADGRVTDDPIEEEYFGTGGVAEIKDMDAKLRNVALHGYSHHVSVTEGHHVDAIEEAFSRYLGYNVITL